MSVSWKSSHDCFWSWMSRPSYISRCTAKALNESYHAGSRQGSTGQARALNQIGLNGSRDHLLSFWLMVLSSVAVGLKAASQQRSL